MNTGDDHLQVPQWEIEQMLRDFADEYDPLSIQLLFSIRALARRINEAASRWLAPFGLTATKYNYLAVLYANRESGLSPSQIAAVVHTVSGTVTSMLNALESEKLIRRTVHHADRRSAVIRLTSRGERLFFEAAQVHHAHIATVVKTLGRVKAAALLEGVLGLGKAVAAHSAVLDSRR